MSSQSLMPVLQLGGLALTAEELSLLGRCTIEGGQLRASPPAPDLFEGRAAYVWRMLAWGLSVLPRHRRPPYEAAEYLRGLPDAELVKRELDSLVAKVESFQLPK